ncbi:hypothetical protein [Undibacterium pigrum]|nr:hypothetical protein [Undibacterium pigrum]
MVVTASIVALSTGCATSVQNGPKVRTLSIAEASAYERTLQARATPSHMLPDRKYVQPVNKREPCKLPTTVDQLERSNFRAFWDGQCKNGFAFGLGRDIAISDTHHQEEITIYSADGDNFRGPSVAYDFVNNMIHYVTRGEQYPAATWFREAISSDGENFQIVQSFGVTDEAGNNLYTEYSPLSPTRFFLNDSQNVVFKFTDNSAMPVVNASVANFAAEILDPTTKTSGGVAIIRYGTGEVRHVKLGGPSPEMVALPTEYFNHLSGKLKAVQVALAAGQIKLERAKQIEREYLHMACNGKHTIEGLDKATVTKICDWRNKFKPAYDKSLAKYTSEMEQLRKRAEVAEQQRLAQQQINVQQRQLQQQQSQQELQSFSNTLVQFGQQMQNAGQQSLNSVKLPSTQVDFGPVKPLGGGVVVTCMKVTDSSAYCRD